MSSFTIQVYKNSNSYKAPSIALPDNFPQQESRHPDLIKVAQSLFEASGVLLINNLFSKSLITRLYRSFVETYQPYFEDKEYIDALEVGDKRKMLTIDFKKPFNNPNLYGNLFLMYLMRELLGEGFVLGSFGAVISLPGSKHQHIHRDHPSLFGDEELDLKIPSFAITVVVPLIELTPETGSTRVWKGSHRMSRSIDLDPETSFVPFVPTGSCYLMDYQLLHGGTPNISNEVRPILYITYYRSWFQEAVNYEKQSRICITQEEYQKIPGKYKFLFERVREFIEANRSFHLNKFQNSTPKMFDELTAAEQAERLGNLAKKALESYPFKQAQIQLITHGENTVFSVILPNSSLEDREDNPYCSDRFILRIHRANYLSVEAIESELSWLHFLCHEAKLPVPEPISTADEKLWTLARSSEIPEPRVCSLTRWVKGRSLADERRASRLKLENFEAIGRLMGKLHDQAENWSLPANFTRPRWDWNGLFGEGAGYSNDGALVWELTPPPYRSLFEAVSEKVKKVMAFLGEEKEQFGLIHGDLWLGNLLVCGDEIRPIDFADCGFGYWGYDLARFLSDFSYSQNFSLYLDKVLSGYTQIRAFPEEQLTHLHTLIAAQQVALALWRIARSRDHLSFRSTLEEDLQETAEEVERFLARSDS